VTFTLWRSVRSAHAEQAFSGEGAALYPGRYNAPGVRAVYLADCPAGCALELLASYAAPEAVATHVLFAVEVAADLVDLRRTAVRKRYTVTLAELVAPDDYGAPRRVGARLLAEGRPGAIVPAATVARAFNVVIYPDVWSSFNIRDSQGLALDQRVFERLTPTTV
jgi:RES domain-containing protein